MVSDVDPATIKKAIAETRLLFVDSWAPWCGPCVALAPVLEELSEKYASNPDVKFLKINTQNHPEFAAQNNINAIPCVLVYFEGQPARFESLDTRGGKRAMTDRLIGLRPAAHYETVIHHFLG